MAWSKDGSWLAWESMVASGDSSTWVLESSSSVCVTEDVVLCSRAVRRSLSMAVVATVLVMVPIFMMLSWQPG